MSRAAEEYYEAENRARATRQKRRTRKRLFDGIETIIFGGAMTGVGLYLTYTPSSVPKTGSLYNFLIGIGIIVIIFGIIRITTRHRDNND